MQPMQRIAISITLLAAVVPPPGAEAQTPSCDGAVYNCFMLRVPAAQLDSVLTSHALTLELEVLSGDPRLVLVTGPDSVLPETTPGNLQGDAAVLGAELAEATALTEGATGAGVDTAAPAFQTALTTTGTYSGPGAAYFSAPLWNGYMNQPAAALMNLRRRARRTAARGAGPGRGGDHRHRRRPQPPAAPGRAAAGL